MKQYVIKNNLPNIIGTSSFKVLFGNSRTYKKVTAAQANFEIAMSTLTHYPVKAFVRRHKDSLRARMQVEVDGFYYYVELFEK